MGFFERLVCGATFLSRLTPVRCSLARSLCRFGSETLPEFYLHAPSLNLPRSLSILQVCLTLAARVCAREHEIESVLASW